MAKLIRTEDLKKNLHLWSLKEDHILCELLESCKAEIIGGVDVVEQKLSTAVTSVKELSSYVDNVGARIATSSQTQFLQQIVADEEKHNFTADAEEKKAQKLETAECVSRAITRGMEDVRASRLYSTVEAVSSLPAYIGTSVQCPEKNKKRTDQLLSLPRSRDVEPAVDQDFKSNVFTQEAIVRLSSSTTNNKSRVFFDEDTLDSNAPLSEGNAKYAVPVAKDLPIFSEADFHDDGKTPKSSGSWEPVVFSVSGTSNQAKSSKLVVRTAQDRSSRSSTSSAAEESVKPASSVRGRTIESRPSFENIESTPRASEKIFISSRTLPSQEKTSVSSASEEEDVASIFEQISKVSNHLTSQGGTNPTPSSLADFVQDVSSKSTMQTVDSKIVGNSPAGDREVSVSSIRNDASSSSASATFSPTMDESLESRSSGPFISGSAKGYTIEEVAYSAIPSHTSICNETMNAEDASAPHFLQQTQELPRLFSSERLMCAKVADKYKSIFADEDDGDDLFNIKPKKQPVEVVKDRTLPTKSFSSNFAKSTRDKHARGSMQPHENIPAEPTVAKPLTSSLVTANFVASKAANHNAESKYDVDSYSPLPSLAKNRTRGPNRKPPSNMSPLKFASSDGMNPLMIKAETREALTKDIEDDQGAPKNDSVSTSVPKTASEATMSKNALLSALDFNESKNASTTNAEFSALRCASNTTSKSNASKHASKTTSEPHISNDVSKAPLESSVFGSNLKMLSESGHTNADEKRSVVNQTPEEQSRKRSSTSKTHETKQHTAVKSFFDADSDDGEEDFTVPSKFTEQSSEAKTVYAAKHSSLVTRPASKSIAKSLFSDEEDSDLSIFRKK